MKIKQIFAFCLFLTLSALHLDAVPMQYENLVVDKIITSMSGPLGESYDNQSLKSRLKTREGQFFSQNDFDGDLKLLAQEFDRVDPYLEVVDDKLRIELRIFPRPLIRSICCEGNTKIASGAIQNELSIPLCSVFDRLSFNKAFHKLKGFYIKKGFFEAELSYNVVLDLATNEVDITICITEGRSGRIKEIVFCNFCNAEEEQLLARMATKEYCLFTSWMTNEGTYNEEAMQHDQFVILDYIQNQGFADARINIDVEECAQDRIIVTITADRGSQYHISKISFEGNHLYSDEDILKQFTICEGDIFSPDNIRETNNLINEFYGRRGFIDSHVNFECRLDPDTCSYSVDFTIEEGQQYRVGLIKVFGNSCTQTNVILNETLIVPGEVFNSEKMRKTEERLKNIGYFSNVNVYAVQSEACCVDEGNYRDVHIEVEETSTGHFGLFFGYSTAETLFGGLNITEKNFNSAGIASIFGCGTAGLRGGGEYAHLTFSVGNKSRSYLLSWTKPYFMDTPWSVGFDIEKSSNRYISNDYDIDAAGVTLHANYEINAFLRFGWHYRLRNSKTRIHKHKSGDDNKKDDDSKQQDNGNKHSKEDKELIKASKIGGLISATGIDLSYDSTDRLDFPTQGFRSRLELEYAGLGGDHRFFGIAYLNSYYYPICTNGVIKLRADARFIKTIDTTTFNHLPLDERLFMGGDNNLRGFKAYRIGPRFGESHDPKGGISMQLASLEYNHRFHRRVDGFLFADAGQLSDTEWSINRTIYASLGFGVRLRVLDSFPPICMGFGFPVSYDHRSYVRRFFISFGGKF